MTKRIYLDNAATSWPKPETVYDAIDRYQRENGAPAGRGTYAEATLVERSIAACRASIAELIGANHANEIAFASGCTEALNALIHGWLNPGDHVVTTNFEHNSVLRPLRMLEETGVISVTRIECDENGTIDTNAFARAITEKTRLIAMLHVSNVTGAVLPIEAVGEVAKEHAVPLLVDAAQSVGSIPIDVRNSNISMLAAPGHKSLFGPLGSGFFYVDSSIVEQVRPLRQGGTGTSSDRDSQPIVAPEKFESGNMNVPAIIGLAAGLEFVAGETIKKIGAKVSSLTNQLIDGLSQIDDAKLLLPNRQADSNATRVAKHHSVVSFNIAGYDSREVAALLETEFRIQVRSGFHCAPLIHKSLDAEAGGTVRISPGYFNEPSEIELAVNAIREIAEAALIE